MKARDSNLIVIEMRIRLSYDTLRHKVQLTGFRITVHTASTSHATVRGESSTVETQAAG